MCISGRITGQDVDMLRDLLDQENSAVAIDLKDVLLVDREAIIFLAKCEVDRVEIKNCPGIRTRVDCTRAEREKEDYSPSSEGRNVSRLFVWSVSRQ